MYISTSVSTRLFTTLVKGLQPNTFLDGTPQGKSTTDPVICMLALQMGCTHLVGKSVHCPVWYSKTLNTLRHHKRDCVNSGVGYHKHIA